MFPTKRAGVSYERGVYLPTDSGHWKISYQTGGVTTAPARQPFGRKSFEQAVLGTTFELARSLHGTVEAYWNGAGTTDAARYISEFSGPRFATGELYNAGSLYGGAIADWQVHPPLHVSGAVLLHVTDPSALVAPLLRYSVATNAELLAGAFIPLGAGPREAPSAGLIARSEFGLYPYLYHADLKLYF